MTKHNEILRDRLARWKAATCKEAIVELDRLEARIAEQYTKFSDLILAGGRLLSEAESRVATLEHALRRYGNHTAECGFADVITALAPPVPPK